MDTFELKASISGLIKDAHMSHQTAMKGQLDPDWAIWQADFLFVPLSQLLNMELNRSQLIHCLITAHHEFEIMAPEENWPTYFTDYLITPFVSPESIEDAKLAQNMTPFCPFFIYVMSTMFNFIEKLIIYD